MEIAQNLPPTKFDRSHPVLRTPPVWHPQAPRDRWSVVLLRRRIQLSRPVRRAWLWVSASQRFILYLNGRELARGPSRSDPMHWGCVRVPLGDLPAGQHVLAACAFTFGKESGIGQMGGPAFFLACGEGDPELVQQVRSGPDWRCYHEQARTPLPHHAWGDAACYDVIGAGERVDAGAIAWGWEQPDYDDSSWPAAVILCGGVYNEWGNLPLDHLLRPEPLPPMEHTPQRLSRVAQGPPELMDRAQAWVAGSAPLTIPAESEVRLVLDRGELTNAYPILTISGGQGAHLRMVSAEAPYEHKHVKGNRDEVEGKKILGHLDEFVPDGQAHRALTTLWWRSYRYLELTIRTAAQPLVLEDFVSVFSGYPLVERARFVSDRAHQASHRRHWQVSWRTARLCAHETFFDCPHYEQAQFPGDTRVQAVYHYLIANDDRLARKAIGDFWASRLPDGLTQCRYPSRKVQILPTFSLYWIGMLHDFRIYRGDRGFLEPLLPASRQVLDWFIQRLGPDGMLGWIEHAPFVDWARAFNCGNAPQDENGHSAILSLLLAQACDWQSGLERACGYAELAGRWKRLAGSLRQSTQRLCWDAKRGLLADTARRNSFSQHAQVLAVLGGLWPARRSARVLQRALADSSVQGPGTLYFRYYLAQALRQAGLVAELHQLLGLWDRVLEGTGLSTWPESDGDARSDCHAWSVTPPLEFLQGILGVCPDPAADGMSRLILDPCPGPLQQARGLVPTPHGPVRVTWKRVGDHLQLALDSPVPLHVAALGRDVRAGRRKLVLPLRAAPAVA